ncbi:hypothetical protein LCGC14_0372260 [marine sediment metagenome]|uniref:Uncharacterized protein n=1 Tax=marine sediment metagenome TaxID=412755 RepID=A0A0F9T4S2_9ZZZZ
MDIVEKDFKEVQWPTDVSDHEIIFFLKKLCTFSVDINTKDPELKDWIYKHKDWIRTGKE